MKRNLLRAVAVAAAGAAVVGASAVPASAATPAASNSCDVFTQAFSTRYTVTQKSEDFLSLGAFSTSNSSDKPINLYQSLNVTQSITASGNIDMNYGGFGGGLGAAYTLAWDQYQGVGPYVLDPGVTGRATYGFDVVRFKGTAQMCLPWGQWSSPTQIYGVAPLDLHVIVQQYPNGQATTNPVGIPVDQAMSGLKPMTK